MCKMKKLFNYKCPDDDDDGQTKPDPKEPD